jgi:type I restriction enzyme S subunit
MKVASVPFSWIAQEEHRLDCGPFTTGGIEARKRLERGGFNKDPLVALTRGGLDGMYHVGMDKLRWVDGPDHGVRFLGSADILKADLRKQPYISRRQVSGNRLFSCPAGTTLITRSGTIGRMAYCRQEMAEMAISQDVLKVVPDQERVLPGYLYAFMSSCYGLPLVTNGKFGSIIVHIEAENIASMPVPRFDETFEASVHALVEKAAVLRVFASSTLDRVAGRFDEILADVDIRQSSLRISNAPASQLQARMDAGFHDPVVQRIRARLQDERHTTIGEWCTRVFLPGIFKRIHIEDVTYGAPYYTGSTLFWLEPIPKGILSRRTTLFDDVLLKQGMVLVQAFGQEGGLTGRSVWVGRHLDGVTTTHMLVRLQADSLDKTAYLYGFLQSDAAYKQIASLTYGGSIPHFDEAGISTVVMPLISDDEQTEISKAVLSSVEARDDALSAERSARRMVESAIEEGA